MSEVITDNKTRKLITAQAVIGFVVAAFVVVCCVLIVAIVLPECFYAFGDHEFDSYEAAVIVSVIRAFLIPAIVIFIIVSIALVYIAVTDIRCCVTFLKNRVRINVQFNEKTKAYTICKTYDLAFAVVLVFTVMVTYVFFSACSEAVWWLLGVCIGILAANICFIVLNRICKTNIISSMFQPENVEAIDDIKQ